MRTAISTLPVLVLLAGCAAGDARSDSAVATETAEGVPIVTLGREALAAVPVTQATQALRIGGGTEFTYIRGLGVTRDGGIVVLDQGADDIRVFDTSGTVSRSFGGRGDGPGELQQPQRLVVAGDGVYILDMRGVNRFGADGTYVDRIAIDNAIEGPGGGYAQGFPQSLDWTENGLIITLPQIRMERRNPSQKIVADTMTVQRLDAVTGKVSPPILHVVSAEHHVISRGHEAPAWFAPEPEFVAAADRRMFMTTPDGRSVDVFGQDGAHAGRITFDVEPRPVTDDDMAAVLAFLQERLSDPRMGMSAEEQNAELATMRGLPRAEHHPVIGRLLVSDDGYLLVERTDIGDAMRGRTGPTTWDVVDTMNEVIRRIELPTGFTPMVVQHGIILGTTTDENDVPAVVGYRLS